MSVATSTLPQVLLKQYELLAERYANLVAELEQERSLRKAMEQELASSITQIATIQSARVHLALPKQSVFVRDRAEPKASVVVTPQQGRIVSRN